jgi:hypothetical protein
LRIALVIWIVCTFNYLNSKPTRPEIDRLLGWIRSRLPNRNRRR